MARRAGRVPVVQLGGGWRILDADGEPLPGVHHARTAEQALDLTGLW